MHTQYDGDDVGRVIAGLLDRIAAAFSPDKPLGIIGIRTRGEVLAERLTQALHGRGFGRIERGTLDITLYRDDLSTVGVDPQIKKMEVGANIQNMNVVLCDDVLYTGRTVRAALDALFDHGRPKRVQLLVLIDRGHRELPVEAAFVGRYVQTSDIEIIEVKLQEVDSAEKVLLVEKEI